MLMKIEQNRMVRTIQIFELFDQKWLTIFYKVLTPFWKTFLWLKQLFDAKLINSKTIIFKCSENYGRPSPTRVTRLNVAPNMADPISLNEKDHNKWLCSFLDLQHYDSVKLFIKDNSVNLFCMNMHIFHKHVAVHDIYLSAPTDHISLHI